MTKIEELEERIKSIEIRVSAQDEINKKIFDLA